MGTSDITVSARDAGAGLSILDLAGALTGTAETALNDAIAEAYRSGASTLALDFGRLERIDGSGLTLLFKIGLWAERDGKRLLAFGWSPRCRILFEELGLGTVISFHATEAQVLREVGAIAGDSLAEESARPNQIEACPAAEWATPLGRAHVPAGREMRLNVEGLRIRGPLDGFGQLWQKTYSARLSGADVSPAEVIRLCAERLGEFWPAGNRLRFPASGATPGAVGLLELRLPGGLTVKTGMRVLHVGPTSFTFIPLAGHMEAGLITLSAYDDGCTVFQVESFARTGDPLYELGFLLFGHDEQERFWVSALEAVARHYGVSPRVRVSKMCLDDRRRWAAARNVTHNAAARTGAFLGLGLLSRFLPAGRR